MMENLAQILMLLSVAVTVVVAFQQLHIPTSIGYLLVGVILGPHTIGPTFNVPEFKTLAEFGVVFLLFTIGLNYIPVLGTAVGNLALAGALGWAIGKAVLAFALVFFAGRWLLRPLFQLVTRRRSAEVFTLAVLLVALLAAWTTNTLGLSLAFGAFLVGMMLGETEFR